jgi:hypothetical protein
MRDALTTAIEVAGLALVTAGAALTWPPLGFIVGGVALVLVGWAVGRGGSAE